MEDEIVFYLHIFHVEQMKSLLSLW